MLLLNRRHGKWKKTIQGQYHNLMISCNCILKSSFGTSEPNYNIYKCVISWIIRLMVFQEREISSSSFFPFGRVPSIPSVLDPIWWEIENKSQMQQVGNIFRTEQFILARSPARTVPHISRTMKTLPKAQRTRGLSSTYQSNFYGSYHKFKHKSQLNFICRISTKNQLQIST